MKKTIVVSAINFYVGGPLTVLKASIAALEKYKEQYHIVALVHDRTLIDGYPGLEVIEFKHSRSSWLFRIYYEYIYFWFFSLKIKPFLWLSLHDITPNVVAKHRVVYCHNPSPFYKMNKREKAFDWKFGLFNRFYGLLYKINIKKNDLVIVQQDWIRKEFKKRYKLKKVMVALPVVGEKPDTALPENEVTKAKSRTLFFYPSLPRFFKNFEIIGKAIKLLEERTIADFEVFITMNGAENKYASYILDEFGSLPNLKFIGLQSRTNVEEIYKNSDCLIFPSKLETWGLPLTEYKKYNKPIFAVNLPYARETLGSYDKVVFFDPFDAHKLADMMLEIIEGKPIAFERTFELEYEQPFARNWDESFDVLLKELN